MSSNAQFKALLWPAARAGEALEALVRQAALAAKGQEVPGLPIGLDTTDSAEWGRWVDWAARRLGCEAEALATPMAGYARRLCDSAPALVYLEPQTATDHADVATAGAGETPGQQSGFLVVLKSRGKSVVIVAPDLRLHRIPADDLTAWLSAPLQAPFQSAVDHLLEVAQVPQHRQARARQAMLQEHLAGQQLGLCWMLRPAPTAGFLQQVRQARLPGKVVGMLAAFLAVYLAEILGWGLMGRITLNGRLDTGWLAAWALLVLSLVPLNLLGGWLDATFALDFGRMLKTRLLSGILQSDVDVVRRQGAGQLLSRVMESQALESLALNGGMGVLIATLELGLAGAVLAQGAGGTWHVLLLAGWLLVALGWSLRYFQRLRHWTLMRLDMTHSLVEQMVGHRTRLAQEPAGRRDEREDIALRDYLDSSRAMDQAIIPAAALMPRGWMLVGLCGLFPAFVAGSASAASLAISLGGMLLANRALGGISAGLAALSRARVAWSQVSTLFAQSQAAIDKEPFLSAAQLAGTTGDTQKQVIVQADQISYGYGAQSEQVFKQLSLTIAAGEQVLLEGPSGRGKSTLASLLVGLRTAQSGLLLLNGLDRHTLGDSWHHMVTQAPQFHENHILSGPLAYNLLMGRGWPAGPEDLAMAQQLCEELGLGELLARMPAGLMQMVGETGWQLSHGERSRIFLARALLQNAQLTVLDESFAALDPETLQLCLECALKRSNALLVIAHP